MEWTMVIRHLQVPGRLDFQVEGSMRVSCTAIATADWRTEQNKCTALATSRRGQARPPAVPGSTMAKKLTNGAYLSGHTMSVTL